MQKYITRTFDVTIGKKMVPDFQNMTFNEQEITLIDPEEIPHDVVVTEQHVMKARMPLETFYSNAEKIVLK